LAEAEGLAAEINEESVSLEMSTTVGQSLPAAVVGDGNGGSGGGGGGCGGKRKEAAVNFVFLPTLAVAANSAAAGEPVAAAKKATAAFLFLSVASSYSQDGPRDK